MQDPNHDGLLGTAADNLLVPGLVRDLFSAATPFSLSSKRQTGAAAVSFFPAANWNIDLSYLEENRAGMRPMGSGTYDRLTFIPESGVGQDEIFYLRGTELARPIGYKTGIFRAETSYGLSWGFVSAGLEWSRFKNRSLSLTYSNPVWYTDTYARTAGAVNFPNQESRLSGLSVRLTRQIGKRYSVGIAYWVEQFKLAAARPGVC